MLGWAVWSRTRNRPSTHPFVLGAVGTNKCATFNFGISPEAPGIVTGRGEEGV